MVGSTVEITGVGIELEAADFRADGGGEDETSVWDLGGGRFFFLLPA
jgi:hypothetical protein